MRTRTEDTSIPPHGLLSSSCGDRPGPTTSSHHGLLSSSRGASIDRLVHVFLSCSPWIEWTRGWAANGRRVREVAPCGDAHESTGSEGNGSFPSGGGSRNNRQRMPTMLAAYSDPHRLRHAGIWDCTSPQVYASCRRPDGWCARARPARRERGRAGRPPRSCSPRRPSSYRLRACISPPSSRATSRAAQIGAGAEVPQPIEGVRCWLRSLHMKKEASNDLLRRDEYPRLPRAPLRPKPPADHSCHFTSESTNSAQLR